jgi:hypothetical protein
MTFSCAAIEWTQPPDERARRALSRSPDPGTRFDPIATATAPAANHDEAFSLVTPPVGTNFTFGKGPRSARRYSTPPTLPGKSLMNRAPAEVAIVTSVGVNAPGKASSPRSCAAPITAGFVSGATMKRAPTSATFFTSEVESTIPAPTVARCPTAATTRSIARSPRGARP